MAYGVKYRLEFSDVLGNGKKIEIEKDGYSGSVLPLIGTADPVSIKWDGDDDFYSPIIGSTCTINLFVTDDVQYDNFYAFDEEEFKVKIFYKDASNNYQLYWAGFIVTDSYKQALASPPYQISIQAHDGIGLLETVDMEIRDTDNFSGNQGNTSRSIAQNLIEDAISKTNLGLEVRVSLSLYTVFATTAPVLISAQFNGFAKYTDDLKIVDCKTFIENVLRCFNARIFQSNGYWYIISNSEYLDKDFRDDQADNTITTNLRDHETKMLQQNRTESPEFRVYNTAGIFQNTYQTDVLVETKTDLTPVGNDLVAEYIPPAKIIERVEKLSVANLFKNSLIKDPTFELPTSGWTITSGRAAIGQFPILISGKKSMRTNLSTSSTSTYTQMIGASSVVTGTFSNVNFAPNEEVNYTIPYYLDGQLANVDEPFAINYAIFRRKNIGLFPTIEYWKTDDEEWHTANQIYYNKHIVNEANSFEEFTVTTKEANINANNCQVGITFYLPYKNPGTTLTYLYFDDVNVERKKALSNDKVSIREVSKNSKKITNEFVPGLNTNSFLLRPRNVFYNPPNLGPGHPNTCITQQKLNDFRTHVTRYEGTFYNNNVVPISLANKIWVNFAKKFVTTNQAGTNVNKIYVSTVDIFNDKEGWYVTNGSITTPIQITNVVLGSPVSYYEVDTNITYSSGDVFSFTEFNAVKLPVSNEYPAHEPVSCILDSMEYNVKANTIKVIMHVPNQDDDETSTFKEVTRK